MTISRRSLLIGATAAPFVFTLSLRAHAGVAPVYANGGVAIDGTDPLSYFKNGKPITGDKAITFDWNGATWRFTSEENKADFANNPDAYAPRYGGYCAWAVSEGYTASTVPEAWKIVDNKLYLNYSRRIQRRWEKDIPARIAAGDANWPGLLA